MTKLASTELQRAWAPAFAVGEQALVVVRQANGAASERASERPLATPSNGDSKATAFGTVMINICFLGYLLYHWLMLTLNNDDQSEISCFLRQLKPFQNFPESWSPDRLLYSFLKL